MRAHPKLFEEESLPPAHRQWLEYADRLRAEGRISNDAEQVVQLGEGVGFVPLKRSSDRGCMAFVGCGALVLGAIAALSGALSLSAGSAYLGWGILAVGAVLAIVGLAFLGRLLRSFLPAHRRMERHYRGRAYGLFLFPDAFVLRSFPERVPHRSGWCGARFFPWAQVVDVTTKTFSGTYGGAASTDAVLGAVRVRTDDGVEEIALPFSPESVAYDGVRRWWARAR